MKAAAVLLSRLRLPVRGAGIESSNHRTIQQLTYQIKCLLARNDAPSSLCRAALTAVETREGRPWSDPPTNGSLE
ncbi:uncharacterized protein K444DRAFT_617382 [Hyaloscypha bicolor E]|uniref:Uncharacterized protein n=1 Tax=Hyaloscypha bicolor E TaxID=1095630 RepID=A0A2J6SVX5_9HELO|nr:uncharacterized protein K444DRAFT_617382 [Hyaloscypha bicolor E]PMD54932.1 hypothetical protein K444DRAFT_617382 [Hyaloscypha bicolor E]